MLKIKRKPIVMVRRVGKHFEYYIQQGNRKINFFVDQETHDDLKQQQALAELGPQKVEGPRGVIPLQEAETGRTS